MTAVNKYNMHAPIENAESRPTEHTVGILHFDEWGKKQVSRISQLEIREVLNDMSNDPTNFAGRVAAAQAENAEWHRQHPTRWAGTNGCNPRNETERRALADAATAAHRDLTFAEKMQIVERLRQR
jgi:hypothetical protein